MDNEPPPQDTVAAKLERVFAALVGRDRCPVCQCEEWLVLEDPDAVPAVPIYGRGKDGRPATARGPLGAMEIYAISCRKCGYIRLHRRSQIDAADRALAEGRQIDVE